METFQRELNALLIAVYQNIQRFEELALQQSEKVDLTISEMHLIEYVGAHMPRGATIRELAEQLNIKSPSVTVAVQKLEIKGYITKAACPEDKRAVRVQLTRAGRCVEAYHQYYHRILTKRIAQDLTEEEQGVLLRGIRNLNAHFVEHIQEQEDR